MVIIFQFSLSFHLIRENWLQLCPPLLQDFDKITPLIKISNSLTKKTILQETPLPLNEIPKWLYFLTGFEFISWSPWAMANIANILTQANIDKKKWLLVFLIVLNIFSEFTSTKGVTFHKRKISASWNSRLNPFFQIVWKF